MTDFDITKTGNSRVFTIQYRASPVNIPAYKSCIRATGASRGYGDIERIECPNPTKYGDWVEVGSIKGAAERPTSSLEGRYPLNAVSDLLKFANLGCPIDVQIHFGSCTDPSVFNKFEKALFFENVLITNYATDDLGALASGDNAAVNETADISAESFYEVVPVVYAKRADSVITNEIYDVVVCDSVSCGECTDQSNGCEKIFAITKAAGGSAGTPPDIVYSIDGGTTWYAHDIDTLTTAQSPDEIECLGDYLVVVSNAAGSLSYALKSEMDGMTDPTWTETVVGIVGAPNAIWSTGAYAFIVGAGGYVYGTGDPTGGVDVLDAASATTENLFAVHGLSDAFAVAVGASGAVVYTDDGVLWTASAAIPVGVGVNLLCVWVRSESEWWVGASNGRMYYTLNGGNSWTEKGFSGSGTGTVEAIVFPTDSVGFMTHTTTTPHGRIFRTYNGGYSWTLTPEESSASLPANDSINALAFCSSDPNFLVGVGLADDGADGYIVVGSAT